MDKDILRDTLTSIENWCKNNDISIFWGSIDENTATEVNWSKTNVKDWEKYLSIVNKINGKLIIIDTIINDVDPDDEEILSHKEILEDEELQEYENSLKVLQKTKDQIAYFKLYFFDNDVCFGYSQFSEWFDDYLTIHRTSKDEDEDDNDLLSSRSEKLDDKRIEELARKITVNEKYLSAKNPVQRNEIAEMILKQENVSNTFNIWTVRRKAESIFETEVKPKQDEKTRKNVLELKAKNFKKVEIASKLNISRDMVNKFYYTDND